jgi:hypothetical protein
MAVDYLSSSGQREGGPNRNSLAFAWEWLTNGFTSEGVKILRCDGESVQLFEALERAQKMKPFVNPWFFTLADNSSGREGGSEIDHTWDVCHG